MLERELVHEARRLAGCVRELALPRSPRPVQVRARHYLEQLRTVPERIAHSPANEAGLTRQQVEGFLRQVQRFVDENGPG